jgi:hypothetical protein
MKSGDPAPLSDLQTLLAQKRSLPSTTVEVVSEAARWLKAQLKGAEVDFHYAACEDRDHYGFAVFVITRNVPEGRYLLELKVAEIDEKPFLSANAKMHGRYETSLFPYFSAMHTEEERRRALQYISDFLLGTK